MRGQKKVFIVDFDNTILDMEGLKKYVISKSTNKSAFERAYQNAKKESGYFKPENLPENYKDYFLKAPYKKYLFPKSLEGIKKLQKIGRVILFSFGDDHYQKLKIDETGAGAVVGKKNVIIVQDKKSGVEKLVKDLKKAKYNEITIIDDVAEVLEKAFEILPQVITIWIRYGKYQNRIPMMRNAVTYEVESFEEAVDFIQRLVGLISLPKTHIRYPVLRGLDIENTRDLISYTNRDKKISMCTHDDGRFKNKKTFTAWKSRGKVLYSLSARTGKLLGVIWFARKKYHDFPYTVAVRTYPPIRGKGYSNKFMRCSMDDFYLTHKKIGLWLVMQKGNLSAEHLYRKIGFKQKEEKGNEIFMVYAK